MVINVGHKNNLLSLISYSVISSCRDIDACEYKLNELSMLDTGLLNCAKFKFE